MYALSLLDVGFKFESRICNKCYNVLMTAYELKNMLSLGVFYGVLVEMRLLIG